MEKIASVINMKKSEELHISKLAHSYDLMEIAGMEAFKLIDNKFNNILILAGTGNNAGDGYVIARELLKINKNVTIYLLKEKFSSDSLYFYNQIKEKANIIINENINFNEYDLIIDSLLGTGFEGSLKDEYKDIILKANDSNAYKIAIDINSGLSAKTGLADIAFKSDLTIAIGYLKPGHLLNMAKDYIKELKVANINLKLIDEPYYLLNDNDLKPLFKKRLNYSHKGSYGYDVLIGGSIYYSGAIRLASIANASVRSGAGVVKVAVPNVIAKEIIPNIIDATIYPLSSDDKYIIFNEEEIKDLIKNTKTISFGMGIGNTIETKKLLKYLLDNYENNLIIDADGLNALSEMDLNILNETKAKIILTPHIKEFSRLINLNINDILKDQIELAKAFAKKYNLILLLKGTTTVITDGSKVYLSNTGTPGMARGGSGDVLSGIITSLVGFNDDLLLATAGSAYINGKAGEYALKEHSEYTMTASDTALNVAKVIDDIINL
ncbi:MAG: NAD(P)H-hydrate dehydratase [Acholeplasmatales bacterium]|nr:NAD(P)H-hydrate dehydratase [Acholeplasmatales bacterium]